mmetsp:Transcript_64546/g.110879  ORF Transcript_64546/g.110879 Transcript_64546/m.110879 type:complete len:86 (+) Transcript_64546:410-667(+)
MSLYVVYSSSSSSSSPPRLRSTPTPPLLLLLLLLLLASPRAYEEIGDEDARSTGAAALLVSDGMDDEGSDEDNAAVDAFDECEVP